MRIPRLCRRLAMLEVQRRPKVVAAVLQRARQCPPSELRAVLLAALTTVERATALAIMDQLTETELAALMGPERAGFLDTRSESELEALTKGNPGALQRFERAFQRWRQSHS